MKYPKAPPSQKELFSAYANPDALTRILGVTIDDSQYLHWDELRHRTPPPGLDHRQWWFALKMGRLGRKAVPLRDVGGNQFGFQSPDPTPELLREIDLGAGGKIGMPAPINSDTRDEYYLGSLIEEAITSSQLEGATTTRRVAKEMLRTGRKPNDRSERMILNNFRTMRRIGEIKEQPLSVDLVFEIHRLVTEDTLDDPSAAGRFRHESEAVVVVDDRGEVFHDPPKATELSERMAAMCDFANQSHGEGPFLHPVIRSIVLHFWLAYDHPFVDGNGRTARALFYWSMLRHRYWLFEFVSISTIILKAPAQYGYAFLYTETDDNDLTYFILYHLRVIQRAVAELHDYLARTTLKRQEIEAELAGMHALNHRQRAFMSHALKHPYHRYTIQSHLRSHGVVYQTARTDLLDLVERGLILSARVRGKWEFRPAPDLRSRLAK